MWGPYRDGHDAAGNRRGVVTVTSQKEASS